MGVADTLISYLLLALGGSNLTPVAALEKLKELQDSLNIDIPLVSIENVHELIALLS